MEKKEFLDVSREYFKSIGFQTLKKSKFYYESNELVLRVELFHSNYDEYYYIYYFIILKSLHNDGIFEDLNGDISGRVVWDEKRCFDVKYTLLKKEEYMNFLKYLSNQQILPIVKDGINYVKKLVNNSKAVGVYIFFIKDDKERILSL